jgi:hypothetical protein
LRMQDLCTGRAYRDARQGDDQIFPWKIMRRSFLVFAYGATSSTPSRNLGCCVRSKSRTGANARYAESKLAARR